MDIKLVQQNIMDKAKRDYEIYKEKNKRFDIEQPKTGLQTIMKLEYHYTLNDIMNNAITCCSKIEKRLGTH
jgi:hypothetical protein